jgi:hypothetical protein
MPRAKASRGRKRKKRGRGRSRKRRRLATRNRRVGGFYGFERKYLDDTIVNYAIQEKMTGGGVGIVQSMNTPMQGSGASNRDGRAANMLSVHIQGVIDWRADTDAADIPCPVRIFLLLDTQNNLAATSAHDLNQVFELPSDPAVPDAMAFRNLEYTQRFKIIADKTYYPPSLALYKTTATEQHLALTRAFEIHKPLGFVTHYAANTGATTDINDNALFLCAVQVRADSSVTTSTRTVNLNCLTRLRFSG